MYCRTRVYISIVVKTLATNTTTYYAASDIAKDEKNV